MLSLWGWFILYLEDRLRRLVFSGRVCERAINGEGIPVFFVGGKALEFAQATFLRQHRWQ